MSNKIDRAAAYGSALGVIGISTAITIWKNGGINSHGPIDTALFIGFLMLLAWLILPGAARRDGRHHEKPGNGLAFRLGKTLGGILWSRKRGL